MSEQLIKALEKISDLCPVYSGEYTELATPSDFGGNADDFSREQGLRQAAAIGDIARYALSTHHAAPGAPQQASGATRRLTEAEIEDCIDRANRNFNRRNQGPSGQQLTSYDDWKHWLAREVEDASRAAATAPDDGVTPGAYLRKKAEDYAMEYGSDDMGGLSFGSGAHAEVKMDHYNNLLELADELDALTTAARAADDTGTSKEGGDDGR